MTYVNEMELLRMRLTPGLSVPEHIHGVTIPNWSPFLIVHFHKRTLFDNE